MDRRGHMPVSVIVLLGVAGLVWLATSGMVLALRQSDMAGNSLTYSFASLAAVVLWVLLAIVMVVAVLRGEMAGWARWAALVLVPLSGAAAVQAIGVVFRNRVPLAGAMMVVPILLPLLIAGYAAWALVPAWRARVPAEPWAAVVWGLVGLLSVVPWVVGGGMGGRR